MQKNFDVWNMQKKIIDKKENPFFFHEGEIWRTSLGANVGSEPCGKGGTFRRPVLIIKKLSATSCIVIPISTQKKIGTWYGEYKVHGIDYFALLYQIRMISTNRFQRRLCVLDNKDFLTIKQKTKLLLDF